MLPIRALLLSTAAVCLLNAGCGGDALVIAKGKLLKNGKPLELSRRGEVTINFFAVDDAGNVTTRENYMAEADRTGAFEVVGKQRKGIPPGKYKISVVIIDPSPGGPDILEGAFTSRNTKIVREVTPGGEELVIDLDKPSG